MVYSVSIVDGKARVAVTESGYNVYLYSEGDLYRRRLLKCEEVDFDKVNMSVKDEFIKRLSNFT